MTEKSKQRRMKDAQARNAIGGNKNTKFNREKASRSWYELKIVHAKTQSYMEQLGKQMEQYLNPLVLLRIARHGKSERFIELQKQIQSKAPEFMTRFEELYKKHEDKKKLCLSLKELEEAMNIMQQYDTFNLDFFNAFKEIIDELNTIFNTALKELIAEKDQAAIDATQEAQEKIQQGIAKEVLPVEIPPLKVF